MAILLPIAVVLAMLSLGLSASEVQPSRPYSSVLTVTNGQTFGEWTWPEMCPGKSYAVGFRLRVESNRYGRDDTSVNGIGVFCQINDSRKEIQSHTGHWGDWSRTQDCPRGQRLISFALRVEGKRGLRDDTAVNNIIFRCTGNQLLEGDGNNWGEYGFWSKECRDGGICGIETNMEKRQGLGDDTALNDVRFFCCSQSQK